MSPETQFLETNALMALLREDEAEAEAILKDMLPGELGALSRVCGQLAMMARDEQRAKRASS